MKKRFLLLFIVILSSFFIACDSEDKETTILPPDEAIVWVFFEDDKSGENYFPDINSLVYVYYNIDEKLYSYNMEKQSVFKKILVNYDEKVIPPNDTYKINEEGFVKFNIKDTNNSITIITVSNFHDRASISRFSSPIDYTIIYRKLPKSLLYR